MKNPLLKTAQAAELLNLSPWRVRVYIGAGLLPARKVGRGYRIHKADVDAFAEEV